MRHELRLMAAGIAMVGMTFGLARYGYGLLLPEMRKAFDVSSATLGLIATCSYAAYLATTTALSAVASRLTPRAPVALGGALAVAGMALVAVAQTPLALGVGITIAGSAAALAYPPFSDAIARDVPPRRQGRALAIISAGTGWGVLLAVAIALATPGNWRLAWALFTVVAIGATVFAAAALKRTAAQHTDVPPLKLSFSWFVCPRSGPLLFGALLVGIGASVYWTFAVDFVTGSGLPRSAGPILLGVVGVASILGSFAGDMLDRLGGRAAQRVNAIALAGSMFALAAAPGSWVAVIVSAIAFGAAYNLLLAVQAIWSGRVFVDHPSTGLAAMLAMLGVGQLIGPTLAGALADGAGLAVALCVGGATIAATALLAPREEIRVGLAQPAGA